jgi:hypothetical protein
MTAPSTPISDAKTYAIINDDGSVDFLAIKSADSNVPLPSMTDEDIERANAMIKKAKSKTASERAQ